MASILKFPEGGRNAAAQRVAAPAAGQLVAIRGDLDVTLELVEFLRSLGGDKYLDRFNRSTWPAVKASGD